MFVFAQPFSLGDVGGGSRILRSVFDHAPTQVCSLFTGISRPLPSWHGPEIPVPMRPSMGRMEHTRLSPFGGLIERFYAPMFKTAVKEILERLQPAGVHLVPHGWSDFAAVSSACKELHIPVHISMHDDFRHTAGGHWFLSSLERQLAELWNTATSRMVISEEMGTELSARYGRQPYVIHTDGALPQNPLARCRKDPPVEIYFMGMYLHGYKDNFRVLFEALSHLNKDLTGQEKIVFRARTYGLNPPQNHDVSLINIRPFADHALVSEELRQAQFLYLPLPFGAEHQAFSKFSLSTKMVTYLASGVPILYHGPADSAAAGYLRRNDAGILLESNTVESMVVGVRAALTNSARLQTVSENALLAVRRDFDPQTLRQRFWNTVGYVQ